MRLLAAVLVVGWATAQEPTTRPAVFGSVVADDGGAGIDGGVVEVFASARRGARRGTGGGLSGGAPGAGAEPIARTTTAGDGTFGVSVPDGVVFVRAAKSGFATEYRQVEAPITEALRFRLKRGVELRGRAVDVRGAGIVGAAVGLAGVVATTGSDGGFVLRDLSPAEEAPVVTVRATGFAAAESRPAWPPDAERPCVVTLERAGTLRVRVVDGAGAPLAGAAVAARLPFAEPFSEMQRAEFSGRTDDAGGVRLEGFPPGKPVVVHAFAEGRVAGQSDVVLPTEPDVDGAEPVVVVLDVGRAASVRVRGPDGRPVAGAQCGVASPVEPRGDFRGFTPREAEAAGPREAVTDADGLARFERLPADLLVLEVRAAGLLTQAVPFVPGAGATELAVDLVVDPNPPPARVPWRALAEGFREGAAKGLPVLVSLTMDDEVANDAMAVGHFRDPEVVRALSAVVPVLGSAFGPRGATSESVSEGERARARAAGRDATLLRHAEEDGLCTRYGSVSCAAHQQTEQWAVDAFFGGRRDFSVPKQIVVGPDGETLEHRTYALSERELTRLAVRALRRTRPDLAASAAAARMPREAAALRAGDAATVATLVRLANAGDESAAALLLGPEAPPAARVGLMAGAVAGLAPPPADPAPPSREDLLERAAASGWKAVPAMRALRRLAGGDVGEDDATRTLYLERAQDDSDLVREEAVSGLAASASTANDVLRAALADQVAEIRILAALALKARGEDSGGEVLEAARSHVEFGARVRAALGE